MKRLLGRRLLTAEISDEGLKKLDQSVQKIPGLIIEGKIAICQRCGSQFSSTLFTLADGRIYCPYCVNLGRVTQGDFLWQLPREKYLLQSVQPHYPHPLTKAQAKVSEWLLGKEKQSPACLVWAVTGAGKTEMTFALIAKVLASGGQVAWASPRIDVCLEIAPRLKKSFPSVPQVVLYGQSQEKYQGEALVVCTTHQLVRFYGSLSLLIIDEVDAFPFANDDLLQRAALTALKKEGRLVMLTATPTKNQLKKMNTGDLAYTILPARFHQKSLSVPTFFWCWRWSEKLLKKIPATICQLLAQDCWLIFCPEILWMEKFLLCLQKYFPEKKITSVHAKDPLRLEKVLQIRAQQFDLILCTTILERGVTLPGIQVLVIGAEERIYQKEVLVQIAGRVGRSIDEPTGTVCFLHGGKSAAMVAAKQEIIQLNRMAQKEGLLNDLL
ncbi:DEAD/DEAH box helicase [Enterococcus timonensis]|uniref:DEAD/DEAH box helicase n=1 Tax=Enterococcus timonensis TaxID=1852364 RepID=UPI0008D9CFCE|nr:DEAD/DEAH box helicase [Enterococcus timonensis]